MPLSEGSAVAALHCLLAPPTSPGWRTWLHQLRQPVAGSYVGALKAASDADMQAGVQQAAERTASPASASLAEDPVAAYQMTLFVKG